MLYVENNYSWQVGEMYIKKFKFNYSFLNDGDYKMRFIDWEIGWKDILYYLTLPLFIAGYYILILTGNIQDNLFIYDGTGNIPIFLFLIPFFYFSIFRQPRFKRYIITILTSILIFIIAKISMIIYTLSLHIFTYGQSGVVYALWGFTFINLFNMLLNYKKETPEMIVAISGFFVSSALPLIYPPFFFIMFCCVAYQVHIISYFLGIIIGLVLQILFFEDNIFLKLKNKGGGK